jgi:hypothetical protein
VNGNSFNTVGLNAGNYPIQYSYYDNESGCTVRANRYFTVNAAPNALWTGGDFALCENQHSPFTLAGATPAGGVYQGAGIYASNMFYPDSVGVGTHEIRYIYTQASTGCSDTAVRNVVISALPLVSWSGSDLGYCINETSVALSGGSPAGGIYLGTAVSGGNSFNPSLAGEGVFEINYVYTQSSTGCKDTATNSVTVYGLPTVTWSNLLANCCLNDPAITLSGGLPSGGEYSGSGVNQNIFNPSIAGLGSHQLTYSYTDLHNCSSSANQSITVNSCTGITEQQGDISAWIEAGQIMFSQNHYFESAFSVKVYDAQGQLVLSRDFKGDLEKSPISQNKLAKGLYFVHFTNGTTVKMFKVIN